MLRPPLTVTTADAAIVATDATEDIPTLADNPDMTANLCSRLESFCEESLVMAAHCLVDRSN